MKKYALPIIAFSTGFLAIAGTHFPTLSKHMSGAMFLPASATNSERFLASVNSRGTEALTPQQIEELREVLSEMGIDQNYYGVELVNAARINNLTLVQLLLALDTDINSQDSSGNTALIWAAYYGHTDMVRFLVTVENINLDYVDTDGCSALRWANMRGHSECAEILRRAGANNIRRAPRTETSISQEEAVSRLQLLSIRPETYNAAICSATDESNNDLLLYLIIAGADVNSVGEDGFTPITNVCLYGNTDGLRLLLAAPGIDINKPNRNGDTAIIWAAVRGNVECLRLLLAEPSININHVDSEGKTAYDWAVENEHEECAELLRAAGNITSGNRNSATPKGGNNGTAQERLRAMGITPDEYNQAICDATDNKNNELLHLLIAAGADVNAIGNDGWTPLTNSCLYENVEGVRLLLAAPGIDVNKPNNSGDTPLQIAARKTNTEIMRLLHAAGAAAATDNAAAPANGDRNAQEQLREMGITPSNYNQAICTATDNKNNELLSLLIAAGADVNAIGNDGWTPLTNCCLYENIDGVRLLLAAPGIQVNKPNNGGDTPLQVATRQSNTEIIRLLNRAGATSAPDNTPAPANADRAAQNQLREQGITPSNYNQAICDATDNKNNELLRLLIAAGADVNHQGLDGWTPLTNCCLYENVEGVRLLLAAPGIDVNKPNGSGSTPLLVAGRQSNEEILRLLNRAGATAAPDSTPAPANGDRTSQVQLRERGITPSQYNQAICNATDQQNNDLLRLLIAAGANVNATGADGWTPLTNCCVYGNVEGVRILLETPGIDVNKPNDDGKTPLQIATEKSHREIVRMLNRAGATTTSSNAAASSGSNRSAQEQLRERGISPSNYNQAICEASDNKNNELLRLLIAAGADVNATGDDGWTPLTNSCLYENEEGVRLLLAAPGIQVNKPNRTGDTAIIWAAVKGNIVCLRLLMNMPGIDINFIDSDGKTALEWAQENCHTECVEMLRRAGAKTAAQVRRR